MALNKRKATQTEKVSNECAQCGTALIAPVWSEYLRDRCGAVVICVGIRCDAISDWMKLSLQAARSIPGSSPGT